MASKLMTFVYFPFGSSLCFFSLRPLDLIGVNVRATLTKKITKLIVNKNELLSAPGAF